MNKLLIFMLVCLLLVGTARADIISDAMNGIGGIIEGAKDIINLDKSSTTISLSSKAKEVYEGKVIKATETNGTTLKRIFQLKSDNNYISTIDVPLKKCVKFNITIQTMKVCIQWNNKNKCIKNKMLVQRNRGGCIEYADKSKEEILSEIDSKSKFALDNSIKGNVNKVNGFNIEREIGI